MSTDPCSHARTALRWAAAGLLSVTRGPQRPTEHLATLATVRLSLDRAQALLVVAARDSGASWGEIGRALGVSRQAARQRFGALAPVALPARESVRDDDVLVNGARYRRVT